MGYCIRGNAIHKYCRKQLTIRDVYISERATAKFIGDDFYSISY